MLSSIQKGFMQGSVRKIQDPTALEVDYKNDMVDADITKYLITLSQSTGRQRRGTAPVEP